LLFTVLSSGLMWWLMSLWSSNSSGCIISEQTSQATRKSIL
jgi:hypothetical protein